MLSDTLQGLNITCMTGGRGQIVLGDGQGRLHFLSLEGGEVKISMTPAYLSQVSHMTQLKQNNYIITVGVRGGEEEGRGGEGAVPGRSERERERENTLRFVLMSSRYVFVAV